MDALHRLWTDPQVRRYLWDDRVIERAEAQAQVCTSQETFRRRGFGHWIVETQSGVPELVGSCGLRELGDPPEVELLYAIAPAHWGRGYATEASRAVLRRAFDDLGLERVLAGADPPNVASFRVMERLGMRSIGPRIVNGTLADYHELTRSDHRRLEEGG